MSLRRVVRLGLAFALVLAGAAPSDSAPLGPSGTLATLTPAQTLRTSGDPYGIAIDALGSRAYVADAKENTLFVFDLATGDALAYVPTGRQPHQVALAGSRAFVSNFTDATITVVDTATNRALRTLVIGGLGLALDAAANRLYAAAGSRIFVLDLATEKLVATIPAPAGANLWGLALDAATNRLYATDIAAPRVLVFDALRNALVAEVAIDAPGRFAIAADKGKVFVASYTDRSPQLSVIDGASLTVVARAATSAFTRALVLDGGTAYALSPDTRSVTQVSATTLAALSATAFSETQVPGALAVHPTGGVVTVTAGGGRPERPTMSDPLPVVQP